MPDSLSEPTIVPISPAVAEAIAEGIHKDGEAPSASEQDSAADRRAGSKASQDSEPVPAVPPQVNAQDRQQPFRLGDIRVGNKDRRGIAITHIYAAQSEEYAIYQAGGVMVHFADDQTKEQAQRKAILPISSARAEVNALSDGLAGREVCDRQLAYGLQLALDGDIEGAKAT